MTGPGSRLRAFAARWCCAETMERVVDPLIADLQREDGEARRTGRVWKGRSIRLAAAVAFTKVMVMCAWAELTSANRWSADDRRAVARVFAVAVPVVIAVTALLELPYVGHYPKVLRAPDSMRFLYLAPLPFSPRSRQAARSGSHSDWADGRFPGASPRPSSSLR